MRIVCLWRSKIDELIGLNKIVEINLYLDLSEASNFVSHPITISFSSIFVHTLSQCPNTLGDQFSPIVFITGPLCAALWLGFCGSPGTDGSSRSPGEPCAATATQGIQLPAAGARARWPSVIRRRQWPRIHEQKKFESFERINSIRETNGNFDSCNSCKRLGTSRLHELHDSKFPFVSRIEFIRSKLSNFSAHVYGANVINDLGWIPFGATPVD